jgi:DNA-binding NarL/FixJ family response regulator
MIKLSEREKKVIELFLLGLRNTQIGKQLGMPRTTVGFILRELAKCFGIQGGNRRVKLAVTLAQPMVREALRDDRALAS